MATYTYEQLKDEYQRLWETMKVTRDAPELHRVAEKIKKHQAVYEKVQKETGVPWQMVAVIHLREAGSSDIGVFKGVLHNGQKIVGTNKKTTIVPKDRGPFATWHEAAVDALKLKKFHTIKSWPVSRMLWGLEPYNGYGYRNKGLRSPYLWAATNHQQPGKYVADHVFDPNHMDQQVGCAAQLKFLGVDQKPTSVPSVEQKPVIKGEETGAAVTAGAGGILTWLFPTYGTEIVVGTIVAVVVIYTIIRVIKERKTNA